MNSIVKSTFPQAAVLGTEQMKTLRNTYGLLSMTLLFSAGAAGLSMMMNWGHPGLLLTLAGYFGLLFGIHMCRNSGWGIALVFALTGFMGITLGPVLNAYMTLANGPMMIGFSLGLTGFIFLSLSAYTLASQKDFSSWGASLTIGIVIAFVAGLGAIFFQMPALSLTVSVLFTLLMSGLILFETSNIIHGGERNYILATVTLYVSIYNLFMSLLHISGVFSANE